MQKMNFYFLKNVKISTDNLTALIHISPKVTKKALSFLRNEGEG
jgi:hypothetical protein